MRVLLVEDHAKLALTLANGLRREGMAVDVVFDGHDALSHAAATPYDVVVLDRDIPGVHGDEVCRRLVAKGSESRILMLTAARSVADRVEGLGLGADDYLPKPFDFSELVARIRALGRRSHPALPPTLTYGDLRLDSARHVASQGRAATRPQSQRVRRARAACSAPAGRSSLRRRSSSVSGTSRSTPSARRSRRPMSRLRAKLGEPPLIETVAKSGYRISG